MAATLAKIVFVIMAIGIAVVLLMVLLGLAILF